MLFTLQRYKFLSKSQQVTHKYLEPQKMLFTLQRYKFLSKSQRIGFIYWFYIWCCLPCKGTNHATRILVENIMKPPKEELNETRRYLDASKREMARQRKAIDSANSWRQCCWRASLWTWWCCPGTARKRRRRWRTDKGGVDKADGGGETAVRSEMMWGCEVNRWDRADRWDRWDGGLWLVVVLVVLLPFLAKSFDISLWHIHDNHWQQEQECYENRNANWNIRIKIWIHI